MTLKTDSLLESYVWTTSLKVFPGGRWDMESTDRGTHLASWLANH